MDVQWWIPGIGTVNREQFSTIPDAFNDLRAGTGSVGKFSIGTETGSDH